MQKEERKIGKGRGERRGGRGKREREEKSRQRQREERTEMREQRQRQAEGCKDDLLTSVKSWRVTFPLSSLS